MISLHVCRTSPVSCLWRRWRSCWAYTSCAAGGAGTFRAATPAVGWASTRGWIGSPDSWWPLVSWTLPKCKNLSVLARTDSPVTTPTPPAFWALLTGSSHHFQILTLKTARFYACPPHLSFFVHQRGQRKTKMHLLSLASLNRKHRNYKTTHPPRNKPNGPKTWVQTTNAHPGSFVRQRTHNVTHCLL